MDACTCKVLKQIIDREVNAKLIQFLMGLSDAYESVKTHVLTLEPLPPLNKAFALLQKVEKQKQLHDQTDTLSDATAFHSSRGQDNASWKKPRVSANNDSFAGKECHYCHNFGHTKLEGFKLRERSHCGRKVHAKENCFSLTSGPIRQTHGRGRSGASAGKRFGLGNYRRGAHHADVLPIVVAVEDHYIDDEQLFDPLTADHSNHQPQCSSQVQQPPPQMDSTQVDGIVQTVLEQVMKAFSEKTTGGTGGLSTVNFAGTVNPSLAFLAVHQSAMYDWIIDTGASDHMTSSPGILHDVRRLAQPVLVALPDGSVKSVTQTGSFVLNQHLVLHNVLVVPSFRHNLLSVGRLIEHSDITASFNDNHCIFQDRSNKKILDVAPRT
ncbi:hypothetical protein RND81_01G070400 [Saponaria officinalis]|uniref:Retrovirus-related Pol polyprotein from transposon TNT 1-94-like beta-barrel domain-containing protein n=1 Tax=Saponaria officinalis TaxID=3572 RepID=A0AAW1NCC8_SAPOF